MTKASLFLFAALSTAASVQAQSALSGPVPGFAYDPPTRSLRAVTGSLGSASLGPPIVGLLEFASAAPRQNYAVAMRGGELLFVSGLGTPQFSTNVLQTAASTPDGAVWSDDGTIVVLYSKSANWLQIYTGFPTSISSAAQFVIPIGGSLSAVAVDAHGQHIVVGVTGTQGGVFQIATDQSFSPLAQITAPISLSFSPDATTLYALDGSTNLVSEITLSNLGAQNWPSGVDDAVAIRAAVDSSGRGVLYIAGRNSRLLAALDCTTRQPIATAMLSFAPAVIEPLGSNGFLLTRRSTAMNLLWTFANNPQPSVYFIPASTIQDPRREVQHP